MCQHGDGAWWGVSGTCLLWGGGGGEGVFTCLLSEECLSTMTDQSQTKRIPIPRPIKSIVGYY